MPQSDSDAPIRNISDTAIWAAMYRAGETDRPEPLFRDPFARRLAGERGERIFASMPGQEKHSWAWVIRTYSFDQFIEQQVRDGVDMVINLAAGLDARPYRMALPPQLRWIEVDLPDLLSWKENVLRDEQPRCRLERVALDLSDVAARRQLFARLGAESRKALVITEGLLIYLERDEVAALAEDLRAALGFQHWVLDIASPGLLRMLQGEIGDRLSEAKAPLKFGPTEGPDFFAAHGWRKMGVASTAKTGARLHRGPFFLRIVTLLPEPARPGNRPWGGVCLFAKEPLAQNIGELDGHSSAEPHRV
jgi:methyltransferase (TIGR00027 family)